MNAEARFRALFNETYPALRRYAHYRGLSASDSDDLAADVFTVAWRRIDDVPADAAPWLFAVARNVLRNTRRSEARRTRLLTRLPRPEPQLPPEPAPDHDVDRVRSALASMDPSDRELLTLVAWDDLTPQQAAAALGWPAGATRVRLHRARKRLAGILAAAETRASVRTDIDRHRDAEREVPDAHT